MARVSPISVLGAVVLLTIPGQQGCHRTLAPELNDPEGVTVAGDLPVLQALEGQGFTAIWIDRDLAWGERIQRIELDGSLTVLGDHGHVWMDHGSAQGYRWDGADDHVEVVPSTLELGLAAAQQPVPAQRGDALGRKLSWKGADLYGLPVALVVERDGEAWLHPSCEDGLPCWRDEPGWWGRWEQGDIPQELGIDWWAEAQEPGVTTIELRLEIVLDELGSELGATSDSVVETGRRLRWGDVHSHSNLSYDGCEDPDHGCLPQGDRPGTEMFAVAEEFGLDFLALTDHAEFEIYNRSDLGLDLSIHAETLRLAAEAEGGPVIPIVGFEWTGVYNDYDEATGSLETGGGHRTVIFDDLTPCEDYWVGASTPETRKDELGLERYVYRQRLKAQPDEMLQAMAEAAEGCDALRHLSWFHHPGLDRPRPVNWGLGVHRELRDAVVEIYSEHGSSECADLGAAGCDWSVDEALYEPTGSVQSALQLGYPLGFVAGTDSHDGRPGSMADGPGAIVGGSPGSDEGFHLQFAPGGVTGALVAGEQPGRREIVDAIELRNTLAASWIFDAVRIAALGQDGVVYLPGDDVPAAAAPLELMVQVQDQAVDSWRLELVDAWGDVHLDADGPSLREPMDLPVGELRYLRVRAFLGEDEHRLWASPFFGVR